MDPSPLQMCTWTTYNSTDVGWWIATVSPVPKPTVSFAGKPRLRDDLLEHRFGIPDQENLEAL